MRLRTLLVSPVVALLGLAAFVALAADSSAPAPKGKPLKVLFLGDRGHHRPADRYAQLAPVLAGRGIAMTYTEDMSELNADALGKYDALVIYANTTQIRKDQEQALL